VAVILEVKAGPLAGQRVAVMGGQTMTVGRTPRASFAVPHDTFMSGVHFAVEYGAKGCVLTDQKSSNGTFLNGTRVNQATLKAGDEVRSGQTVFSVRFVDEELVPAAAKPLASQASPLPLPAQPSLRPSARPATLESPARMQPAAPVARAPVSNPIATAKTPRAPRPITIGSWNFARIPDGWVEAGEYGIQRDTPGAFPSSVVATEEALGASFSLQHYVEAQLAMLRQHLREPRIEAIVPPTIQGAQDSAAVDVVYKTKDDQAVLYRRIYVRAGRTAGVLAFTTLQGELSKVAPAFDAITSGASFSPAANADK
jgi:pSer/pThr/pTyr-binding forkhead associated (FHA) protein